MLAAAAGPRKVGPLKGLYKLQLARQSQGVGELGLLAEAENIAAADMIRVHSTLARWCPCQPEKCLETAKIGPDSMEQALA